MSPHSNNYSHVGQVGTLRPIVNRPRSAEQPPPKRADVIGAKAASLPHMLAILNPVKILALLLMTTTIGTAGSILAHGHRGARAMRPENTIPAFEYAIQAGVDVLELDMAVTKDDVLVVSHDPLLNPEICKGHGSSRPIRTLTLS